MNLRVALRSGIGEPRNSEAVDDIEQKRKKETQEKSQSSGTADHVVVNYRAMAPVQRLRRGRVLHSDAGETDGRPRCCKLPQDGAGGTSESDRTTARSASGEEKRR